MEPTVKWDLDADTYVEVGRLSLKKYKEEYLNHARGFYSPSYAEAETEYIRKLREVILNETTSGSYKLEPESEPKPDDLSDLKDNPTFGMF